MLLFGEYAIIHGGIALAMPLKNFSGSWTSSPTLSDLKPFFNHLKTISGYNINAIEEAIRDNWIFSSNIPIGYGVGSSGALSAAAFDSFYDVSQLDNIQIQSVLAQTESFFHGNSSGLDPLTSYFNASILCENNTISVYENLKPKIKLSLLDSKKARSTKPLVEFYLNKRNSDPAFKNVVEKMNDLNKSLVYDFLNDKQEGFMKNIKALSALQLEHFNKMIPLDIYRLWERGLKSESFYMKLSGAGGGGFFLVCGDTKGLKSQATLLDLK